MEVRIGVLHSPKELCLEMDGAPEDVSQAYDEAMQREDAVLWLTDVKGRRVGVPAERVAYLEIETNASTKRVGFGG